MKRPWLPLAALLIFTSCAENFPDEVPDTPPFELSAQAAPIDPVIERAITAPAVVDTMATADRGVMVTFETTLPPPTARDVCNALIYTRFGVEAVETCFRAVTFEQGWLQADIDRWVPWVIHHPQGVMYGESEHCPYRVGGDLVTDECLTYRCAATAGKDPIRYNQLGLPYCKGGGEDTGFGQATRSWWGPGGLICKNHGYCSRDAIVATPYDSMLASIVLLIEYDGSGPWCFTKPWNAYNYHHCWDAPDR